MAFLAMAMAMGMAGAMAISLFLIDKFCWKTKIYSFKIG